jgi:ATPase subunit of ABC transporter with duplicated ATPase domains
VVYARNYVSDKFVWNEYNNLAYTRRSHAEMVRQAAQQKQLQEENRRREIAAVQAREEASRKETQAREEAEKSAARKKFEEFVKKNGVHEWPNMNNISTNPFVYEGKTVAIASFFEEMLTSTDGVFRQGANYFVVSNIPKELLTSKATVVLAGNILGKKEVKIHESGTKLIPHLSFVGTYFCQKDDCSDILKR